MSKIFKLVVVFMFIASPGMCVRMLYPGDVVKGKQITETFFCLTEKENSDLLRKVETLELSLEILKLKDDQIKLLEERVTALQSQVAAKNELRDVMQAAYERARARERELEAIATKVTDELERQKRRNKRMFGTGIIAGALVGGGAVVGIAKEFK